MIHINESAPYERHACGDYGPEHMVRISPKTARGLCGMYPMPAMGYEVVVAVNNDPAIGKPRLYVANISGDYFVQSHCVSIDAWPDVFGVTVKRKGA